MSEQDSKQIGRRQFIRLAGVSVVTTSIAGLAACSGGDSGNTTPAPTAAPKAAPPPAPKPVAQKPAMTEPAMTEPAMEKPAAAAPADMPKLSESDPVAMSLGYKHDASKVDLSKHPRRGEPGAENQHCKNCVLYQGKAGDEWGGCSIFAGKLVNANGWCATYAPKA